MEYFDGVIQTTLHKSLDLSLHIPLLLLVVVVVVVVGQGCLIKRHSVAALTAVGKRVANFRLHACRTPHTRAASLSPSSRWFSGDILIVKLPSCQLTSLV